MKIQCFCFNEQTLQPGETMDFPVVFYIDPAVRADSNTAHLQELTLSYTYFASKNGQPLGRARDDGRQECENQFLRPSKILAGRVFDAPDF